jgi:AcrR family transcriptional regulator
MKNNKRLNPEIRANQIIEAGLKVASVHGWRAVTREAVALEAQVSPAMVNVRFSTMAQLLRSVMRKAIDDRVLHVVAQGYAAGDPTALKIDDELKRLALSSI